MRHTWGLVQEDGREKLFPMGCRVFPQRESLPVQEANHSQGTERDGDWDELVPGSSQAWRVYLESQLCGPIDSDFSLKSGRLGFWSPVTKSPD